MPEDASKKEESSSPLIRGYSVAPPLARWEPVLEEWLLMIERASRMTDGSDSAFGKRELSNVALLAAAVWRSGGTATTEFAHDKGRGRRSRADLKVLHPEHRARPIPPRAKRYVEDLIEAKYDWFSLARRDLFAKLEAKHEEACRDATDSQSPVYTSTLALTFGGCYIPGRSASRMPAAIDALVAQVQHSDHSLKAWCFPPEHQQFKTSKAGNRTPGVVLIGDAVA